MTAALLAERQTTPSQPHEYSSTSGAAGALGPRAGQSGDFTMIFTRRSIAAMAIAVSTVCGPMMTTVAHADDRSKLAAAAITSLHQLEANEPRSNFYAKRADAVLVFPSILKGGLIFGAETGNGVLMVHGKVAGYYNLSGGSWGLQAGGQDFAYALFFMTPGSISYLKKADGFAAGTGPSITVINQSAAAAADTTTVSQDVVAFPYNGKGLMADLTLQGTKITRIHPH
jgi:lipid-binding SYLF domain-containing protein